jgi:peroxiredoxin
MSTQAKLAMAGAKMPMAGNRAPKATVKDTSGNDIALSSFWREGPVVLVFLRHYGCPFCREHLVRLRDDFAKFQDAGANIVCVGMGDPKVGKAFSILMSLPFPLVVTGDDALAFRAYGMNRAGLSQMFGLRTILKGLSATFRGHLAAIPQADPYQMPGVFIADETGIVRYAHNYRQIGDNPDNAVLLEILENLSARSAAVAR